MSQTRHAPLSFVIHVETNAPPVGVIANFAIQQHLYYGGQFLKLQEKYFIKMTKVTCIVVFALLSFD